jgi:DNA-binding response OmpR family regulator
MTAQIRLPLPENDRLELKVGVGATSSRASLSIAQQRHDPPGLAGKRILVIEDEPLISLDLEAILITAGCEVVGSAGTLEQARGLIADAECDAALVDGNLAGQPVDDLAIALTQKNVPFAFITGYGRDSLPNGFREATVVSKPFHQDQLLAAVESILHRTGVIQLRRKAS